MAGIYTFAPPWGLSRVPMPCWQRKTSRAVPAVIYVGAPTAPRADGRHENGVARDENGIFLRSHDRRRRRGPSVRLAGEVGPGINRQRGTSVRASANRDDKIRRNRSATNYRGYRCVIDCFTRLPSTFFAIRERRPSPAAAITPARLFSACNPVIYLLARPARERNYYFPKDFPRARMIDRFIIISSIFIGIVRERAYKHD